MLTELRESTEPNDFFEYQEIEGYTRDQYVLINL